MTGSQVRILFAPAAARFEVRPQLYLVIFFPAPWREDLMGGFAFGNTFAVAAVLMGALASADEFKLSSHRRNSSLLILSVEALVILEFLSTDSST